MALVVSECGGYWDAKELAAECDEQRTVLLLAESADGGAAVAGVVLVWCVADEAQIMEVAVGPAFRRRGIGRMLLAHALDISERKVKAQAGRGAAILEVMVGNDAAIALYAGLGFRKVGLRRDYYPDGSDAILMRLPFT